MNTKEPPKRKPRGKAKPKDLTRKQKAFADYLLTNPKESATKAAAMTYNVKNTKTAGSIATENMAKPAIVSYLASHNNLVEDTITSVILDYKDSEHLGQRTLAVNTAQWVHDKIHGKATQKVETTGVHITMNIDSEDLKLIS